MQCKHLYVCNTPSGEIYLYWPTAIITSNLCVSTYYKKNAIYFVLMIYCVFHYSWERGKRYIKSLKVDHLIILWLVKTSRMEYNFTIKSSSSWLFYKIFMFVFSQNNTKVFCLQIKHFKRSNFVVNLMHDMKIE